MTNIGTGNFIYANDLAVMLNSLNYGDGVVIGLAVSQRGAGANMSVDVAVGGAMANDTFTSITSTTNKAIDAADPTKDRIDLITIDDSNTINVTKGTDAVGGEGDPINPPSIPSDETLLAYVYVEHGATQITDADITDCRVFLKNWRLVHSSNGGASTDNFSYKANMATSKVLVIASVYNTVETGYSSNSEDATTYDYIKVDTVAKKTQPSYIYIYVQASPGNVGMKVKYNASLNCVLTESEMTLASDHTITVEADATVNSVFIFAR